MLEIESPGLLTTIQDLGRPGFGASGIPISGACDPISLKIGNLLVGNRPGAAGMETLLWGLKFKAIDETEISITGAYLNPRLNGKKVDQWRSIHINAGDVIDFLPFNIRTKHGCRSYICFKGGIKAEDIMGSKSTYVYGKLGGLSGEVLKAKDIIDVNGSMDRLEDCTIFKRELIPKYSSQWKLRILRGPSENLFLPESYHTLLNNSWEVTPKASRFGLRLKGPRLRFRSFKAGSFNEKDNRHPSNIPTQGVPVGGIEVLGGDEIAVIGVDGPSITGFSTAGVVISADQWKLGQMRPDDTVIFQETTLEYAQSELLKQRKLFLLSNFIESAVHK
jgi:antagonist of KipI